MYTSFFLIFLKMLYLAEKIITIQKYCWTFTQVSLGVGKISSSRKLVFHWAVHTLAAAPEKGTVTHIQGVGEASAQELERLQNT